MLKTIKVKKQLRLDELIKYVWDNAIYPSHFESHAGFKIHFDSRAGIKVDNDYVHGDATVFTVEEEEEITEETEFEAFVIITDKGILKSINNYHNMRAVRGLLENYEVEQKIYALIDNNLELIWEAE